MVETPVFHSQQVFRRHRRVLENYLVGGGTPHPQLAVHRVDGQPRTVLLDDEGADALVAHGAVLGGEDDDGLGDRGVGDEHLAAVQEVGAIPLGGGGLQCRGVGPTARFGQPEGGHPLPGGQGRQQTLLLVFAAEGVDAGNAQCQVRQPTHAGRGIAPGHLLCRDGHLPVAGRAAASVLGVDPQAHQPQSGQAAPLLPLEFGAFVRFLGLWRNLLVDESPEGRLEHLLLFGQYQVRHWCSLHPIT